MSAIKNNLDEIVNVDIEISTPASSDESFSNILFVVPAPDGTGTETIGTSVISITQPSDLKDYGFTVEHQAYIMATVAFSQSPEPDKIFVIVRSSTLNDNDEPVYESMADGLDRALAAGGWYGITLAKTFNNATDLEATIAWTEANKKLFGYAFDTATNPVSSTNYFRSFGVYCGGVPDKVTTPDENFYIPVAMMAKCFGYDPGSETWALKALAGVNPCKLTSTMKTYCDNNNITYFTTYAKKNITSAMGGKVLGNEWIDTIRFRDWLKNDMQERVFNLLVLNQKVPYTDDGITAVEGKMEESLKAGQNVGGIAPTEYDDDDNETPGYTITVPKSLDLTDAQKASRRLEGCKFKARLAGAIQAVEINGNLVYA